MTISPTFYEQFFCVNAFFEAFMSFNWLFIFLAKNIGAKVSHQMFVKLTTVVDFINFLHAHFCTGDVRAKC